MPPKELRKDSTLFLVGSIEENIPPDKLPTFGDVLKMIGFEKHKSAGVKTNREIVACPYMPTTLSPICISNGGCLERGEGCVMFQIKKRWEQAGFKIIKEKAVINKLIKSILDHKEAAKNKHRKTKTEETKRDRFKEKMSFLFDIGIKDLEKNIASDRLRSKEDIAEDLLFLANQRDPTKRFGKLGDRDGSYDGKVLDKDYRDALATAAASSHKVVDTLEDSETNNNVEAESDNEDDKDFEDIVVKNKPKIFEETVVITKKVAKATAITAIRYGLSATGQATLLNAAVNSAGGNSMNLPLSVSSFRRARIQATAEKASDIKEEFRELMKDGHKKLVDHFYSKDIENAIDEIEKKDRLAVLVSSPQFGNGPPHYGQPQLLGIPAVANGTGVVMAKAVLQLLDEWQAAGNVIAQCYDTTNSNSN